VNKLCHIITSGVPLFSRSKAGYMSRVYANNSHKHVVLGSSPYSYIWRCASMSEPVLVTSEKTWKGGGIPVAFWAGIWRWLRGYTQIASFLSFSHKQMYCKSNTHSNLMRCPSIYLKFLRLTPWLPWFWRRRYYRLSWIDVFPAVYQGWGRNHFVKYL
jgi:hypothetical protein